MVVDAPESTFVGRAAELKTLRGALTRVRDHGPETLLLGGEAGGGKTRLIREFTHGLDAKALCGECLEIGSDGLPYAPFVAMLRDLVREMGVEAVYALLPGGPGELARLLPEFGAPSMPSDESRARLYEQILTLFEHVAADRPLVLIVEDAHWAERSTRDLILFLTRNLTTGHVLLILTFRSDELHRTHPLRTLLSGLARGRSTTRVDLPALTRAEVAEQAASLRGRELVPTFVDDLYERSAGNPLFVEALVECDDGSCDLPESLRDLMLRQITRLPEATQDALRTVAASPGAVSHTLVARVSGLDDALLTDSLRPAVAANVLIPTDDGYAFRHALIREAVHSEALPGEHPRLHKRFAEEIEADPALVPPARLPAELAYHWHAAREHAKALVAAWRAADRARDRLAYAEQLEMLERVLDLWDQVPDAEELIGADEVRPLELAATAARNTADSMRAKSLATAALRRLDPEADRGRIAMLLELRAKAHAYQWSDQSIVDLRQAAELLDDSVPLTTRSVVLSSLAQYLSLQTNNDEAVAYAEEAMELARQAGEPAPEAQALITFSSLTTGPEDLAEARAHLERARALALGACRYDIVVRASVNESHLLEGAGEYATSVEVARAGLAQATKFGLARSQGTFLTVNLAESLLSAGRWDEAAEVVDAALDLIPPPDHRFLLMNCKGQLSLARGDLGAAKEAAQISHAIRGDRFFRAQERLPQLLLKIGIALAEGDPRPALDEVLRALADPRAQSSSRYSWPLVCLTARAIRALTAPEPAAAGPADPDGAFAKLAALADRLAVRGRAQRAYELTWHAESLQIQGSVQPALDGWDTARAAWSELSNPYEFAQATTGGVAAALRIGDREAAERRLREAVPVADDLRAAPLRAELDELAHRGRLTLAETPSTAPAKTDLGLTPRERDVLSLVAAGRTNRQIADELYISAKTASVHVSNILGKLGAASRGEAAATAHRLHLFD
ncbi:MAG TPA: AAA family ATPase [Streptosporangiaceae bacterium]|jgi:ATP/maltotriose-dependent transcriptional regulator MalT